MQSKRLFAKLLVFIIFFFKHYISRFSIFLARNLNRFVDVIVLENQQ